MLVMLRPLGSDPELTEKLTLCENGVLQKLAVVRGCEYDWPTVPFAKDTLVMVKDPDEVPPLMAMLRFCEAWLFEASVTVAVKPYTPELDGVPLITPEDGVSDRPLGSAPLIDQV